MNKDTQNYIDGIKKRISEVKKKEPVWQIDYEKYGGLLAYQVVRNTYWKISSYYIDTEGRYDATNFPLSGYEEGITKLLKQFRKDLVTPIKYYETN